jgi:uncharacterized protein YecE (DUF72 family)
MKQGQGTARIGTSGFHYNHWRRVFYPEELPKSRWFSYYARYFDTVEINNTFYHLPPGPTFDGWRKQAAPGFVYALKFNRYGSHWMRLKTPAATIGNFLNAAKRLKEVLGPVLVQLPPRWNIDAERLDDFLKAAPRAVRWAVEFRDPRWLCPEIYEILQRHRSALCIHDMIENHPRILTTDWTYLRYHGHRYSGNYSSKHLANEAKWMDRQLADGADVFAYFNNDVEGHAVANAVELKRHLGTETRTGAEAKSTGFAGRATRNRER